VDVRTINEHLQNLFSSNELDKISVIRNFRIVQIEGTRQVERNACCELAKNGRVWL